MKKHFLTMLGILFTILILSGSLSLYAQTGRTFYLFDTTAKTLVEVDTMGNQTDYVIDTSDKVYIGANDLHFSSDGHWVTYCPLQQIEPAQYASIATLIVRDVQAEENILEIELGESMGCMVSDFAQGNTRIAVGKVNYFPGTPEAENADVPIWQLQVFDITNGEMVAELTADTISGENQANLVDLSLMPRVVQLTEDSVIFTAIPWGMGGPSELPAYRWNFDETTVERVSYWGKSGFDMLEATGETIWLDWIQELPAGTPSGPLGPFNVVMLQNQADAEPVIIYYNEEWIPINSKFVDGGAKIAILLLESNAELPKTRWIILDRMGNVEEIGTFLGYTNLIGTNDGYAILETAYADENYSPPLTTQLKHVVDVVANTIWVNEAANPMFNWDIVWASTEISETTSALPDFQIVNP